MKELKVMLLIVLGVVMFAESVKARTSRKESSPSSAPRSSSPRSSSPRSFSSRQSSGSGSASISRIQPSPSIRSRPSASGDLSDMRLNSGSTVRNESLIGRSQGFDKSQSRSLYDNLLNRGSRKVISKDETIFNRSKSAPVIRKPDSDSSRQRDTGLSRDTDLGRDTGLSNRLDRKKPESRLPDRRPDLGREPDRGPDLGRRESDFRKPSDRQEYPYRSRSPYYYHRPYYPSSRIFYWIGRPDCCRPICYDYGSGWEFGWFWPYYHRRFIFVSLDGYWPCYPYVRYYWYPCHPYSWYGDYPPEYVITGDTYNYYYYGDQAPVQVPDRGALKEKPPEKPGEATQADRYFEEAVKAFEAKDYATAATKFQDALKQAPDDIVLPFAYLQALFANGQYQEATEVLRETLSKVKPEQEGVFYPRGLYPDENVLKEQIAQLSRAVSLNPLDADLQLLLGYQLLGMAKFDEAIEPLKNAQKDYKNIQSATRLLGLLEKLKKTEEDKID